MTQTIDPALHYRHATYEPLVGQRFGLDGCEAASSLQLVAADELPSAGECFSLRFASPEGVMLPQGTYQLEHPALGTVALFLVPVGPGRSGALELEAVINRLPAAEAHHG